MNDLNTFSFSSFRSKKSDFALKIFMSSPAIKDNIGSTATLLRVTLSFKIKDSKLATVNPNIFDKRACRRFYSSIFK